MRAPLRLLAPIVAAVLGISCGDTLVDGDYPGLELPLACSEDTRCGASCEDCTVKRDLPAGSVGACLGAGAERACGFACTGGKLRCGTAEAPGCCDAAELAAGDEHTCARASDGGLSCWGSDAAGQVTAGPGAADAKVRHPHRVIPSGVGAFDGGPSATCAVISGTVECWGGGLASRKAVGVTGASALAVGRAHACAIVAAGEVRCWRFDATGVESRIAAGATAIVAGWDHACALVGGEVRCWGENGFGQLGLGHTAVTATADPVTGLTGIVAIGAGRHHTCAALATDGEDAVRCWGLAPGFETPQSTPRRLVLGAEIVFDKGVRALAGGRAHVCTQRDSELVPESIECFGLDNTLGQLGLGPGAPTEALDVPVPIPTGFAIGADHGCAISGGGVRCWGANRSAQLGDGTTALPPVGTAVEISGR